MVTKRRRPGVWPREHAVYGGETLLGFIRSDGVAFSAETAHGCLGTFTTSRCATRALVDAGRQRLIARAAR